VAVIPGFVAPKYSGFIGVPNFPAGDSSLAAYHFSQLAAGAVTPAALQGVDTVVLYGLQWATLSASAQSAINAFAQTGKVLIWDADATGSQSYSSFVQPFSTTASGEVKSSTTPGVVVTFPSGTDPLASSNPASPLYLDPSALTANNDLLEDMSVMNPSSAPGWSAGLIAANKTIPQGGWPLAWAYGTAAQQTGMTIYSGMDADVFGESVTPNYALKELAIELATPFQRTAAAGGSTTGTGPTGATSSTGSTGATGPTAVAGPTFARCSFVTRPPSGWVHGRVPLVLKTSVAAGVHGEVLTAAGKVLASGLPSTTGEVKLSVNTRLLPSNRAAKLLAVVLVHSARACSVSTKLRVDNTPPKLLLLKLGSGGLLTLRTSETVRLEIRAGTRTLRTLRVRANATVTLTLPASHSPESVVLIDRAGNRTTRHLR
jgi:hypothetical protein